MHIARLQSADAPQYRALMLEAYALAPDAFTSSAEERALEPESFWVKRLSDPAGLSLAFGAFDDQGLVGTVALKFSDKPKTRHKASVIGMYVGPGARGKGIGSALLGAAIQEAQSRADVLVLTLTVTEGNTSATNLYRAAGFEVFGILPMAIRTPGGFLSKVHMWRRVSHA